MLKASSRIKFLVTLRGFLLDLVAYESVPRAPFLELAHELLPDRGLRQ